MRRTIKIWGKLFSCHGFKIVPTRKFLKAQKLRMFEGNFKKGRKKKKETSLSKYNDLKS